MNASYWKLGWVLEGFGSSRLRKWLSLGVLFGLHRSYRCQCHKFIMLDPVILNALISKLHKMFNINPFVLPSSSPKQLLDVNLIIHGCILWF